VATKESIDNSSSIGPALGPRSKSARSREEGSELTIDLNEKPEANYKNFEAKSIN